MRISYCIECGAALQKENETKYHCSNRHTFWNNAKAGVALAFVRDNQLLVSQRGRKTDPGYGLFDLPGGFVDFNESAQAAAIRESREETGMIITQEDLELLAVYQNLYLPDISTVDIVFLIRNWQGNFQAQDDSAALVWQPFTFIYDPLFYQSNYAGLDQLLRDATAG